MKKCSMPSLLVTTVPDSSISFAKIFIFNPTSFPVTLLFVLALLQACVKPGLPPDHPKNYPSDVATSWMDLNIRLTMITPGFNSVVSDRSFAYAGLTLYESTADLQDVSRPFRVTGKSSAANAFGKALFWPASANAAMAQMTRSFFGNATPAGLASIDSLETMFNNSFTQHASANDIEEAAAYGKAIAGAIFEWSKSDGGHECYLHVTDPTYVPPVGDGLWKPTPPLFGAPILPHWGENRTFVPGITAKTQPGAPTPYSIAPGSPFYKMVDELYQISLTRTVEDSVIAFFWADVPGKLNVPAHATNILTQLIRLNKYNLQQASNAYAKHGLAMYDASITCFQTKYKYTLLRPVTYIREVMGHATWSSLIPTPPHPEYTAAHAVVSGASATVLSKIFGSQYQFTDHTYTSTLGDRSFNNFDDYAVEAGRSRLLGGIHFKPSIMLGITQGNQVGTAVNMLKLSDIQ